MKTLTYTFDDNFDTETMLFENDRRFYNLYGRKNGVEPGVKNFRRSSNGEVYAASSSTYAWDRPCMHLATGELVLRDKSTHHDHRGRYTFGGYDFSIISTSNDPYGAQAIKYMSLPPLRDGAAQPSIKMNLAAFNETKTNDSEGQDLLIDHINDRVYAIGHHHDYANLLDTQHTTEEIRQGIPQDHNSYSTRGYASSPELGFIPVRSIRLTAPQRIRDLPKLYHQTVAACMAWMTHTGMDVYRAFDEELAKLDPNSREHLHMRNRRSYAVKDTIHPTDVVSKTFNGLTPLERALIATNNKNLKLDRLEYRFRALRFDSAAFFASLESA